jgi:hypothetical protein
MRERRRRERWFAQVRALSIGALRPSVRRPQSSSATENKQQCPRANQVSAPSALRASGGGLRASPLPSGAVSGRPPPPPPRNSRPPHQREERSPLFESLSALCCCWPRIFWTWESCVHLENQFLPAREVAILNTLGCIDVFVAWECGTLFNSEEIYHCFCANLAEGCSWGGFLKGCFLNCVLIWIYSFFWDKDKNVFFF